MSIRLTNNYLQFHDVHGENIKLSKNKTVACRSTGFCSGIVFSNRPIRINERVYVKCLEIDPNWSGAVRIGFTMHDPATLKPNLPRYLCPDLTSRHGIWAKCIGDKNAKKDSIFFYYVDESGDVHYGIGTEECGILFGGVLHTSGKLWTVLDVYGNTVAVEFIDPRSLNRDSSNASFQAKGEIRYKEQLQPLSFHSTHGKNVKLSRNRSLASKKAGTHCLAYVFTDRQIKKGETIRMVVRQTDHYCEGLLVYGLTSCDPKNINSHELPVDVNDLLDRSEYWIVREKSYEFEVGDAITFTMNNEGLVKVNFCGQRKGTIDTFHVEDSDFSQPLWLFVNLSHSISELRLSSNFKFEPFRNLNITNVSEEESRNPGASDQSSGECVICCEEQIDCVLYRCGHMCMCYKCASKLKASPTSECPICRGSIHDIIKVYK